MKKTRRTRRPTAKPRRRVGKVIARNNPDGSKIIVSTERRMGVHPYAILIPARSGRGPADRRPARRNPEAEVLGSPGLGKAMQRFRGEWNDVIDRTGSAFEVGRPVPASQARTALAQMARQRTMLPRVELQRFDETEAGLRKVLGVGRANPRRRPVRARARVTARKRVVRRRSR